MVLRARIKQLPWAYELYVLLRHWRGRRALFTADFHEHSGDGSDLSSARAITAALPGLLASLSVRTLLDIPCGDFVWMQHVNLGQTRYIGADIIKPLIASHQGRYASSQRTFATLDLVKDALPEVDLILCRDCLVHCSHRLVKRAIANIQRSGSRYLLTTTFPQHPVNRGIVAGAWQPLNLCAPPFNFPPPLQVIDEGHPSPYDDKSLGLWRVADLPTF